jgi:hypothetical protein
MQLPDGHDRGAQINGARAAPPFSAARCLTSVGPPPVISSSLPPFPCCRVLSLHLLLFGPRGLISFSPPTRSLPRVPLLSTSASHPKESSFLPSSSLSPDVFRHQSSSTILVMCLTLRAGPHAHSPRSVCYSMWQREESSISQSVELVELSPIPRSSY